MKLTREEMVLAFTELITMMRLPKAYIDKKLEHNDDELLKSLQCVKSLLEPEDEITEEIKLILTKI